MKEIPEKENKNMIFLGEEDYAEKMDRIVRPLLDINRKTGYFSSFDGTRLYYEGYDHPLERAVIVMSHGFCEFTKKFEEVIFYFFQAGYSVYICDHRGHGYSQRSVKDGSKVYIRSYDEYVRDFDCFITDIVLQGSLHRKLILYAHSMGGAIAALYLEQHPEVFLCAVLSSPMLEISFGPIPASVVWLVMIYKKLTNSDEDYVPGQGAFDGIPHFETSSCLSEARYKDIFSKRLKDENYRTYGASYAWTYASLRAVRRIKKNAKTVATPVLLIRAGKDTTVRAGGQKAFARHSKNTRLLVIPASKHEIYNAGTAMRKEYYREILTFFEERLHA
jgi:lysophospholipase